MEMVTRVQAYKGLALAILLSAYHEIEKGTFDKEFIESEWCSDICFMGGIVYPRYVKKAYQLKWQYNAKTVVVRIGETGRPKSS